jgi:hypothetical protein
LEVKNQTLIELHYEMVIDLAGQGFWDNAIVKKKLLLLSVVLYTDVKIVNDPLIFFVLKNLMFFYLRNNSSGLICLPLLFLHSSNNLLTYRLSYRF